MVGSSRRTTFAFDLDGRATHTTTTMTDEEFEVYAANQMVVLLQLVAAGTLVLATVLGIHWLVGRREYNPD